MCAHSQVTGESLREVVREVGARLTPHEAQALVQAQLQDRDQKDADQWQVSCNDAQEYHISTACTHAIKSCLTTESSIVFQVL